MCSGVVDEDTSAGDVLICSFVLYELGVIGKLSTQLCGVVSSLVYVEIGGHRVICWRWWLMGSMRLIVNVVLEYASAQNSGGSDA